MLWSHVIVKGKFKIYMLSTYTNFLATSAGASSGFIGLFFVALSFAREELSNGLVRERRIILSGGSFLALFNIFIVSLFSLTGQTKLFSMACVIMSFVALSITYALLSRAIRAGAFSPSSVTRKQSRTFATVAISLYSAQLVCGISLWRNLHASWPIEFMVFVIVGLFTSALMRIWMVMWIPPEKH
ncbi:MAG TPA: hypothetical protein VLF39_02095 [Candidatus Saccharimonadales bacterium]|nr:hypothetical protein [Candidatus Saccharimonadales bacterium]